MYNYPANPNPNNDYPNPNPNGYYPNANSNYNEYNQNPNPNKNCGCIFTAIFYTLITAGGIAGLITLIVMTALEPKPAEFSVSRFKVSNFNLSSNSLTSDFNVSMAVRNPDKKWSISYDEVHVAVLYNTINIKSVINTNDDLIAETSVAPFNQRARDVTDLEARLAAVGFYADEDRIRSRDGDAWFGVRVGFKVHGDRRTTVYCDNIRVGLKTAGVGSMVGPARGCSVY